MSSSNDNRFDEQLDRLLSSSVSPGAEPEGFSGTGAMRALPDTGNLIINDPSNYLTQCPRLDYKVNFIRSGTHYIWVRCYFILVWLHRGKVPKYFNCYFHAAS